MMMHRATTRIFSRVSHRHIKMQGSGIHGNTEGATASTKSWGEKEKAQENMWARQAVSLLLFFPERV